MAEEVPIRNTDAMAKIRSPWFVAIVEAGHPDAIGRPPQTSAPPAPDPFPEGPDKIA